MLHGAPSPALQSRPQGALRLLLCKRHRTGPNAFRWSGGQLPRSAADKKKSSANLGLAGQLARIVGETAVAKMLSIAAIAVVVTSALLFFLWKKRRERADRTVAASDDSASQGIASSENEHLEPKLAEPPACEEVAKAPGPSPNRMVSKEPEESPEAFSRGGADGNDESQIQVSEKDLPHWAVSSAVETAPEIVQPNDEPAGETETESYKPRETPEEPARIAADGAAQAVTHPIRADVTAVAAGSPTIPEGADEAPAEAVIKVIKIDDTPARSPAHEHYNGSTQDRGWRVAE